MGLNGSRVIEIRNVQERMRECRTICKWECPVYGSVHKVSFQGMELNIGESIGGDVPHPMSLHYLVPTNLLLFPDFTLLQDVCPASLLDLLHIIKGVAQMAVSGGPLGLSYGRVGYRSRWGVVGERQVYDPYYMLLQGGQQDGLYASPQQMLDLLHRRQRPTYDVGKADVFVFALLLLEIIFLEKLEHVYDYQTYEIHLNPILHKLKQIKEEYGEPLTNLFVGMMEIEEDNRMDFSEVLEMSDQILSTQMKASQPRHMEQSRNSRTPPKNSFSSRTLQTPKAAEQSNFRNDVSPFRGRFGSNVKVPQRLKGTTPERSPQNRSPLRKPRAFPQAIKHGASPLSRRQL